MIKNQRKKQKTKINFNSSKKYSNITNKIIVYQKTNMKIDYYKEDVNLKKNYKNGKISDIKEDEKLKNIYKSKDKSKNVNFG